MQQLPKNINGKDISLTMAEPTPENAKTLFRLVMRNRDFLAPYFRYLVSDITNQNRALKYLSEAKQAVSYPQCIYFIQKSGQSVGIISVGRKDNVAIVGYWIDKKYVRQGITSQALHLMEKTVFESGCLGVNLNIAPINTPSLMLAIKSGYRECARVYPHQITRCFEKTKDMYEMEHDGIKPRCIYSHQNDIETYVQTARLSSMYMIRR